MNKKRIVILGGGYAGVHGAKKLLKATKKQKNIEITLIDKNNYHTLMTELHEVAGSRVEPDSVRVSFDKIFSGKKRINVVQDEITSIDFDQKIIKGNEEYSYDYLLIGTGGEPADFNIPGISDHAFTLWSFEDAMKIRHHIEDTFIRAAKETDPKVRASLLTFCVAGAGFTGVEMIGELIEVKDRLCKEYSIDTSEVRLILFEALGSILTMLEEKQRGQVMKYLEKKGVEVHLHSLIQEVDTEKVCIKDKECVETKTLIWTCGVFGSDFGDSLGLEAGHTKRQLVNKYMEAPGKDGVYLAGDMIWFLEEDKPLPMIVETALQTAETAAHNIMHAITGKKAKKEHKSNYHGFMVSVGGRWGVSNAMGIKLKGFFAMAMKHFVNLHYLIGVAGINVCWGYIKHEFFDMKDRRTFMGEHFSWKVQGFWTVPLRVWLGLMWVAEGWDKVADGWLKFSLGSKSGWMFSPGVTQSGVKPLSDGVTAASGETAEVVADTVSAASGVVEETVVAVADAVSSASTEVVEVAAVVAEKALWTWNRAAAIIPYDSAFVTWFRELFMDSMASYLPYQLFQTMVVGVEIAVGLALMAGLFTFPAAGVSIILCFVFMFSGMFSWAQLWFVFAAVVMLGGGGRALGLDHWVMPKLKGWWNGRHLAKSTYLYVGEPTKKRSKR